MTPKLTRVATHRARLATLAAILAGLGCSGPSGSPEDGAAASRTATDSAVGAGAGSDPRDRAREEIAALVRGMNHAIDTWDGPGYLAPFARSDSLVFIGSDSSEVTIGYEALAAEILPSFASARGGGRSGAYRHKGLRTGATRDGRVGWWLQEMDYEFEREGERRVYPFRISGLAVRDSAGWRIVLAHASLPVSSDSLHRLLPQAGGPSGSQSSQAVPRARAWPPSPPPPTRPPDPESPGAEDHPSDLDVPELLDRLAQHRLQPDGANDRPDLLSQENDLLVVAEGPDNVEFERENGARLIASFASSDRSRLFVGGIQVWSRDDVAWWYQTDLLRAALPGRPIREPGILQFRSTGAAIREGGAWKILEWHADVPVPNDSTYLFSRPVSAAAAR